MNRSTEPRYFALFKPYGVLSQFTDSEGRPTLKGLGHFPLSVYPVGRLDADSEGLLLLTDDNRLKHALTDPRFRHPRTYVVQIERVPDDVALRHLREGVVLEGKRTRPAEVTLLERDPELPPRPVPVRFRKSVPTAWLEVTLFEGRNRQVRKMTAAVGHPTLRLVRTAVGKIGLKGLIPGQSRELTEGEVLALRSILREGSRNR